MFKLLWELTLPFAPSNSAGLEHTSALSTSNPFPQPVDFVEQIASGDDSRRAAVRRDDQRAQHGMARELAKPDRCMRFEASLG